MSSESAVAGPQLLGATFVPELRGTKFFVYAGARARSVTLNLFESMEDTKAVREVALGPASEPGWQGSPGRLWSTFVEGVGPGQLYGYRVDGPYDPRNGARYNPRKLLLDPYARAIGRLLRWHDALFGYDRGTRNDLAMSELDSAPFAPLGCVVDPTFDWADDRRLDIPWEQTVIYEAHVKGQTMRYPRVPRHVRGTFQGFGSDEHIEHLLRLGATAVELMPIQKGPPSGAHYRNYWKYDTVAFFAPNPELAAYRRPQDVVDELKLLIKRLHAAGLEVILDVVFNHTAEGDHTGPTLCLRGFANEDYYLLGGDSEAGPYRWYRNLSGCGNALNAQNPVALHLILDCLRYWVTEYHVDGFRFDLASLLSLGADAFDPDSPFMQQVRSDPILSLVKLIAEPWDPQCNHVGRFGKPWREWNDKFRDAVRRFWRGDRDVLPQFTTHLLGSREQFKVEDRGDLVSINFVTCHDGFTLHDLVRYVHKHNEKNGEENKDGANDNYSANYGVEGETDNEGINQVRRRQQRNFLLTLALANGVPMLQAGDELDRTLGGNNNAYLDDSPSAWNDWEHAPAWISEFISGALALRRRFAALRWSRSGASWMAADGGMMDDKWGDSERRAVMLLVFGQDDGLKRERKLAVLFNAHWDLSIGFRLPSDEKTAWTCLADSSPESGWFDTRTVTKSVDVPPRSTLVLVADFE